MVETLGDDLDASGLAERSGVRRRRSAAERRRIISGSASRTPHRGGASVRDIWSGHLVGASRRGIEAGHDR